MKWGHRKLVVGHTVLLQIAFEVCWQVCTDNVLPMHFLNLFRVCLDKFAGSMQQTSAEDIGDYDSMICRAMGT